MTCNAYIALGSNVGDRERNILNAIKLISRLGQTRVCRVSNIYETDPVGYTDQSRFLNMVLGIFTEFQPLPLLKKLQEIENGLGRTREIRWGPRTIDIDILIYGNTVLNLPELVIPHPRMLERAFVLIPLRDVYPDSGIDGIDIDDLIDKCNDREGVRLYKEWTMYNVQCTVKNL